MVDDKQLAVAKLGASTIIITYLHSNYGFTAHIYIYEMYMDQSRVKDLLRQSDMK